MYSLESIHAGSTTYSTSGIQVRTKGISIISNHKLRAISVYVERYFFPKSKQLQDTFDKRIIHFQDFLCNKSHTVGYKVTAYNYDSHAETL